ncbi:MAG: insulinase family protein [Xanthomonadales bacterium]|nr:insulinase family protein [Xanthomonadales bacterium]
MKILRAGLLGLIIAACAAPLLAAESRMFDLPYVQRELPNGLKVYIVPTDHADLVSLQVAVSTGSRNEVEPGKSGFAHFFEHMMFRGTPNYPPAAYQDVITRAGANQNAYTTDDYTNYYVDFSKADLDKILEVEADRFQNLSYSEEQFRTEALAVKGEYLKNFSNPIQKLIERVRDLAYQVHPYKHTTMGFLADIEAMPDQLAYSKTFFDRWYRPNYATLLLVGDVDTDSAMALVEKHFGPWQAKPNDFQIPTEPAPQGPTYEHIQWEGPTLPHIVLAYRTPAFSPEDPRHAALAVLGEIWFGQNSALYQQLVVNERSVDALFNYMPTNVDPGLGYLGVRMNKDGDPARVLAALQDTIVKARTVPVDRSVLDATKARIKYGAAAELTTPAAIAGALAQFVHMRRDIETINQYYAQLDAVTPEQLLAVADETLRDSHRTAVSLSNDASYAGIEALSDLDARVAASRSGSTGDIALLAQPGSSALVDVQLLFRTGAAYDPPGKAGLARLTAAMIADAGSQRRGYAELQRTLYPMAAAIDYQLGKEMLLLSGTVHRDNLDAWYEILREQLLSPGFSEADFARVKQQQINAIRVNLRSSNDEEFGKEALYEEVFGHDHPYGRLTAGHAAEVEALTLDDVREFWRSQLTRNRLTIGLAGGYPAEFAGRIQRDLAALPAGDPPSSSRELISAGGGRQALLIQKETPAVAVSFGFPISVKRGDPDWLALWLVRSWLGEHRNSSAQLYKRIREERGMNYGDYAYIEYFPNGMFLSTPEPNYARQQDLFQIWLRPLRNNNDAHFATRAAMFELRELIENGLSEAEFEATRDFLAKFVAQMVDSPSRRLGYALDSQWYGIDAFPDYVRSGLAGLTREQVNAAIRRHLQLQHIQYVYISKDTADLAERLRGNQPSPMSYNSDKSAELLAEDAQIQQIDLGLTGERVRTVDAGVMFE